MLFERHCCSCLIILAVPQGIDIKALGLAYGRRGRALAALRRWDSSVLSFDCQRQAALEIGDPKELAEAFYGMAEGFYRVRTHGREQ
jgi:hypothetical protein